MVGLSILLEAAQKKSVTNTKSPKVINKTMSIKSTSSSLPTSYPSSSLPPVNFLDSCFLCKQRLLPGNDIFMYKGDRAFCSVECRCRQIFMDEESVSVGRERNCSFTAMKPTNLPSSSSTTTSTSSSSRHQRKGTKNRGNGFAY